MEAIPLEHRFWGGRETSFRRWLRNAWGGRPTEGLCWHRRLLFWAIYGVVMGTVFDSIHVHTKTAYYDHTSLIPLLDVAWYVPIEFMLGGILVGMVRPELDEELKRKVSRLSRNNVLLGLGSFFVAWGITGLLTPVCYPSQGAGLPLCTSHPNYVLLGILCALAGATWLAFDRTLEGIGVAFVMMCLGVGVEVYLVNYPLPGLTKEPTYHYTHPDFWGVPIWLPVLYIIAAGALGNMARFLKYPDVRPAGVRELVVRVPLR